ncbi:hypothetical protein C4R87_19405 [Clostridioides difficile]|nr:hypothetical protein [Clostridioides difficile]
MEEIRDKAKIDYFKRVKNKDIAEKYNISINTLKGWIKRYNWSKERKEKGVPKNKKGESKAKKGAPFCNKNSVGKGAPKGNKNNRKHGLYEKVYWDTLKKDEIEMLEEIDFDDEESNLKDQLRLLTVRERRLLKSIEEHKNKKGGLTLESVAKRKLEIEGNLIKDDTQVQSETITKTTSVFEVIHRLESELTRVQAKKTRCIDSLNKMKFDREKLSIEKAKLEIEKIKIFGDDKDDNSEAIQSFLEATTMSEEDIKVLFDDEEGDNENGST